MKTLTIKDLPIAEQLDRRAMSSVRGGMSYLLPSFNFSKTSLSFDTQQMAQQEQNTYNQNGVNDAFAGGIHSKVDPVQKAKNSSTINIGGGLGMLGA
ncbi:hypothetical protein P9239_00800 [Caballeronia sp. LZ062]|uniref:hypothetical protein n=1 Tax=unclassified Caballeronia TaxID=2646786 RepID=UPI00285BE99E|nr:MULTISPECIES: hypothetical protein [unclassified Caballeronia]MDR5857345.1 hypothetical protein [Caballeronia sp. LZ050]MDR5868896.1 hypothetical protein [Caballeronia sp. LZ062]